MPTEAEFAAELTAEIMDGLGDAGMVGTGAYTPKGGASRPCRGAVDNEPLQMLPNGSMRLLERGARITLERAYYSAGVTHSVPAPRKGDAIVIGGASYVVASLEGQPAGLWVVLCEA